MRKVLVLKRSVFEKERRGRGDFKCYLIRPSVTRHYSNDATSHSHTLSFQTSHIKYQYIPYIHQLLLEA